MPIVMITLHKEVERNVCMHYKEHTKHECLKSRAGEHMQIPNASTCMNKERTW